MSKKKSKPQKVERPSRDPDYFSKRDVAYWWAPEWVRSTGSAGYHRKGGPGNFYEIAIKAYPHLWKYLDNDPNAIYGVGLDHVTFGKIVPIKENGTVNLYMKSKSGNLTFIKGSIQQEFKKWHEDKCIDYMLLGMDPDELIE